MTRPAHFDSYPADYQELAEWMHNHPTEPLLIPCPDHRKAMNLRLSIYGFQAAMKKDKAFLNDFPELVYAEIRLTSQGLTLQAREQGENAKLIRAALHPDKKE